MASALIDVIYIVQLMGKFVHSQYIISLSYYNTDLSENMKLQKEFLKLISVSQIYPLFIDFY